MISEKTNKVNDDYKAIIQYCRETKKGKIRTLKAIISSAFGYCYRTSIERINYLIDSEHITTHGIYWEYNTKRNAHIDDDIYKIKIIQEQGNTIQLISKQKEDIGRKISRE